MPNESPMQVPPPRPKGKLDIWWDGNWKWFVPAVCVAVILSMCVFAALIMGSMRLSGAFTGSMARAINTPAVVDAIGKPIRAGYIVSGSMNISGPSGRADLAIPIVGPKGDAMIYVEATKELGEWHFDRLVVQVENTGVRIDLSEGPYKPIHSSEPEPASREGSHF
jgi:hypothetical protein